MVGWCCCASQPDSARVEPWPSYRSQAVCPPELWPRISSPVIKYCAAILCGTSRMGAFWKIGKNRLCVFRKCGKREGVRGKRKNAVRRGRTRAGDLGALVENRPWPGGTWQGFRCGGRRGAGTYVIIAAAAGGGPSLPRWPRRLSWLAKSRSLRTVAMYWPSDWDARGLAGFLRASVLAADPEGIRQRLLKSGTVSLWI